MELGLESWSNNLRRDWSFIFFLFYGQFKSAVSCKKCNKVSTTFDMFTNIPLSLPEPSKIVLNVIVYRLPNEIKDIMKVDKQPTQLNRVESGRSEDIRGFLQHQNSDNDPSNLLKFQESFKYVTNDQPIHICIKVDKDIKIGHLLQQIIEFRDVNIDTGSATSTLILYSAQRNSVRGVFNSDYKLTQYNLLGNEIEAIEVLTKKGRETIAKFYMENPQYCLNINPSAHLQILTSPHSEKPIVQRKVSLQQQTSSKRRGQPMSSQQKQPEQENNLFGIKLDKASLFNSYQVSCEKFAEFEENLNLPDEIYAVAYHRRFVKKNYFFFYPFQP